MSEERKQALNSIDRQYFYDTLLYLSEREEESPKRRLQRLHELFLAFIETLTERGHAQLFGGMMAKLHFVAQNYNLSLKQEAELHGLRRLFKRSGMGYRFTPREKDFLSGVKGFCELLQLFSEGEIPETLPEMWEGEKLPPLTSEKKLSRKLIKEFPCVFKKMERTDNIRQGVRQAEIKCFHPAEGLISVILEDVVLRSKHGIFHKYPIVTLGLWLKEFDQIILTDLEKAEDRYFATTESSYLILNPDYLIDATAIANCSLRKHYNPYLRVLDRVTFFDGNAKTFRGTVLNDMFDLFIRKPDISFDDAYDEALSGHITEAAFLAKEEHKEVKRELKDHFSAVRRHFEPFLDGSRSLTTEPTFISKRYGLLGRLDILSEAEADEPNERPRRDIIEVKTSKAPDPDRGIVAWTNNLMQVACYNLLIDSNFENRRGISAVFYSSDNRQPLRDCGPLNIQKQQAMEIRNKLVALDYGMAVAANAEKVFSDLENRIRASKNIPGYKDPDIKGFSRRWSLSSETERAYFTEFYAFVMRELISAKVGIDSRGGTSQGFANLWRLSQEEKKAQFALLGGLKFESYEAQEDFIRFSREKSAEISALRQGDIVLLYPEHADENPLRQQLLKGVIEKVSDTELNLRLWNRFVPLRFLEHYKSWAVEPNFMESGFNSLFASLASFMGADKEKKELLLGLVKPEFDTKFRIDYTSYGLSNAQNETLGRALSAKNYFLLQGPPGTGKTSQMIRNMVRYLYNETNERVLLLSFTNRATDEISEKVADVTGEHFLKLGTPRDYDPFRERSLSLQGGLKEVKQAILDNRIYVSTVASFFKYLKLQMLKPFDTVIVDEASQLLEPHLSMILTRCKRFILVGDEKQLPAVVTQPSHLCECTNKMLHDIGIYNLSTSIFERLLLNADRKGWQEAYDMLRVQYRTHKTIADFISTEFYKVLTHGTERQTEALTLPTGLSINSGNKEYRLKEMLAGSRKLFIPTPVEGSYKLHKGEAALCTDLLHLLRKIYGPEFAEDTVGVITPYRAQIAEITARIGDELAELVTVDTVERYQGSQRKIIIISMAVSHDALLDNLQSFDLSGETDRKLNVALSRAQEQVILLGNENVLSKAKFYEKFMAFSDRYELDEKLSDFYFNTND